MADRQLTLRLDEAQPGPIARRMRAFGRKAKLAADKMSGHRPIEGFVDRVLAGEIQGWAFDPNKPSRRVHITARYDGEIIAETLADLPRKDLTRDGKGDGKHGFNLRIPASYLDGSPRRLRIEAASGRNRMLLRRGEITIAASRPSAAQRRSKPPPTGAAPAGAMESVANGVLIGWAAQPKSGGAPPVVDVYDDERYLGSTTADRPRPRREDEPRGAKTFHFKLPEGWDEAAVALLRVRITGTQQDLRGLAPGHDGGAPLAKQLNASPVAESAAPERRTALLVFGSQAEDALKRTMRSWSEQRWPSLVIGRLSPSAAGGPNDNVFGPEDAARLTDFLDRAETLVVLQSGETLHPELSRTLASADPLADVLTWDEEGAQLRRPEAWPLAIQLGQSLRGGYAVRLASVRRQGKELTNAALQGEAAFERWLAGSPLQWTHLPAALSSRSNAAVAVSREPAWPTPPRSITLAVWPGWSEAADATMRAALAALSGREIEVLVPSEAPNAVHDALRARHGVMTRKVDPPDNAGAGSWIARLSETAAGEVVLLCRAGLIPTPGTDIGAMAAWATARLAGAVTGVVETPGETTAGLSVARARRGWRIAPAPPQPCSAPVLAAPAEFMAVSRAKLAAVGGIDDKRFPDGGADLDVALRLRRMGWHSLALTDARATLEGGFATSGMEELALFDPAELAAAADAYPIRLAEPRHGAG